MLFDAWVAAGGTVHYIAAEVYPVSGPEIIPHILWTPFQKKEGVLFWAYFILSVPFYAFTVGHRNNIDIVSVFSGIYGFLTILIKVLLNKPIVAFARADVYEINRLHHRFPLRLFLEDILMGVGFKLSNRILSVSLHLKKALSCRYRIPQDKITVLNNHIKDLSPGIFRREALRERLGLKENDFVIVTVAVLGTGKNIDILIKAINRLKAPVTFFIVGDGKDRSRLEKITDHINGIGRFIFTGWKEDVSDLLVLADLFVLPSRYEGCSNALLEALSYGIPSLGSDVAGNREVLQHDLLLFDPDDEKDLSEKIKNMMFNQTYFEGVKALSGQAKKRYIFNWNQRVIQMHQEVMAQ